MKFIVKSSDWKDEFSEIDMMQEAVVRSIRQRAKIPNSHVGMIVECELKKAGRKPKKYYFNTYFMLKLAGLDEQAKRLKQKVIEKFGIDLAKEKENEITT